MEEESLISFYTTYSMMNQIMVKKRPKIALLGIVFLSGFAFNPEWKIFILKPS